MICGGVRVWVFCDVPECLAVLLPGVRKHDILESSPVGLNQEGVAFLSDLLPGNVILALVNNLRTGVASEGPIH